MRHTQSCYFAANSSSSIPRNMSKKPRTKIKHKLHDKWHTSSNQEQRTREGDRAKEGKKGERAGEKMEISKLLVFLVFAFSHSMALPLFGWSFVRHDSCCLASLFPIVRVAFFERNFRLQPTAIELQASRTSTWSTSLVMLLFIRFFLLRVGSFLSLLVRLLHRYPCIIVNLRTTFVVVPILLRPFFGCSVSSSKLEFVQLFHGERFVARFYFGWLVWQKCVESVIDALMGKNSGESHWIIVIRSPELHQIHNNNNNNNRKWM